MTGGASAMGVPRCFFKEGNTIPKIKERDQTNKVKGKGKKKGGRPTQANARRVITAKLKKELTQRKRGGGNPAAEIPRDNFTDTTSTGNITGSASADSNTGAVEQVEQTTQAAAVDMGRAAKRGMTMAASKVKRKHREIKERQRQPDAQGQIPDTPAPGVHSADTVSDPAVHHGRTADGAAASPPPTPGERMRQRAADQRKKQLTRPRVGTPLQGEVPASPHYGGPASASGPSAKNPPAGDHSINPSIKERPRRSNALKEKPAAGAIRPKTRQAVEQAARTRAAPTSVPDPTGKKAAAGKIADRARKKAQREAQRGMLQKSRQTAQAAADLSKRAAQATVKAVKELIGALSALVGGGALAAAMCVILLVAAVIASPFGILFANEPTPGAVPLAAAVNQINMELSDRLAALQTGDYSAIDIQGAAPDWREVAAVFACKTAMGTDGVDVAALTPDRVARLKAVFWDMCALSSKVETIEHPATDDTEAWAEHKLHITITAKSADDMRTAYAFSADQNSTLTELLDELDVIGGLLANLGISDEKVIEVLQRLPDDLSPERRAVVETACKLVGKVNYFWGGKSSAIGWDPRWGTLMKVTSPGNDTSGTYRPFGLDCSGFLDWVLKNVGLPSDGHWYINRNLTAVSTANAKPGDFALYPDASHIGVVVGRNEAGKLLVCHCASGQNNIVITEFSASGFTVVGKLAFMD